MPTFEDLQQDARSLSESLTHALAKQSSFGSLFCTWSLSTPHKQLFDDAYLIQQTANCLDFYSGATHSGHVINSHTKHLVLIGIYAYVWFKYDNTLQWFLNKPLLGLLQQHLGIESLSELDLEIYKTSLMELENFCCWVYEKSTQYQQTKNLFEAFPTNMQGSLHAQRGQLASDSWGGFSDLMTKIGIKSLF
ncbi:hypothetical protein [Legionella brunensis]|uniref:Uncharacterized protein n=1 Tax=Legionella brunensis TaxID=29422 RepID=A0A0W0SLE5_9GAMM|nr:hypothetical protein [Legionella brunensis]KTC84184.1 hypothetical protein Lbru_1545 [Legionella brunensis]